MEWKNTYFDARFWDALQRGSAGFSKQELLQQVAEGLRGAPGPSPTPSLLAATPGQVAYAHWPVSAVRWRFWP